MSFATRIPIPAVLNHYQLSFLPPFSPFCVRNLERCLCGGVVRVSPARDFVRPRRLRKEPSRRRGDQLP